MDQPIIKSSRLKDKSNKSMCNYSDELRDAHVHIHTKDVKNDVKNKWRVSKKCSAFKMCSNLSNHQLKNDHYKPLVMYESHGNYKPKTYNRCTKNKGDLNKSLKRVFNVQEKKARKATTTKTTRKE